MAEVSELVFKVDASEVEKAIAALDRLADRASVLDAVSGELISDPLQDAITSTEVACRTAEGVTLLVLQDHLARLCKMQRKQFKEG